MLPKPNFNSNPTNPVLNRTPQPNGQNWFQYDPNRSLNGYAVNNYPNYTNTYANPYPPIQPVFWQQNNANVTNVWQSNGFHNQMNPRFNQNYIRNNGQNYQKNDFQNKRFRSNDSKSWNSNANNSDRNKSLNCDTCCRWFSTQEQYDQHMSEHIMCGLDECKFKAHPKVIESHQRMQHFCFKDRSLVKQFMSLETEEDIQKWKEERKKNFPTKDNVKRKQELKESEKAIERNGIKRKNYPKEDKNNGIESINESEETNAKEVETKYENQSISNKRNKKKSKKGFKGIERQMPSNGRQNRKLTLFQKLMSMDVQSDEQKEESKNAINV